jgi:hypothetical protein
VQADCSAVYSQDGDELVEELDGGVPSPIRPAIDGPKCNGNVIALVVLWRLRYKLSLRDLAEMFLIRGFVFTYEAVRDWEAKLTTALVEEPRRRRKGKAGHSWYIDETYIRCTGIGSTFTARSTVMEPWSM